MFVNTGNNTGDENSSKSSRDPVAVDKVLSVCRKGTIFTIHKNKVIDTIE